MSLPEPQKNTDGISSKFNPNSRLFGMLSHADGGASSAGDDNSGTSQHGSSYSPARQSSSRTKVGNNRHRREKEDNPENSENGGSERKHSHNPEEDEGEKNERTSKSPGEGKIPESANSAKHDSVSAAEHAVGAENAAASLAGKGLNQLEGVDPSQVAAVGQALVAGNIGDSLNQATDLALKETTTQLYNWMLFSVIPSFGLTIILADLLWAVASLFEHITDRKVFKLNALQKGGLLALNGILVFIVLVFGLSIYIYACSGTSSTVLKISGWVGITPDFCKSLSH